MHYSPLKQIDTTNVKRLGLAWSWGNRIAFGRKDRIDSTDVEWRDVRWDVLFAVDARTGKMKWRWESERFSDRDADCCRHLAMPQGFRNS